MINKALMFCKFVKYDLLNIMLNENPSTKDMIKHPLSIYIDIMSIYNDIIAGDFVASDTKTIAVNVLNMAAHYRHFFRNLLKMPVRVFLVNSVNNFNLTGNICMDYNYKNTRDIFNTIEVLCKYLPDIYYVFRNSDFNATAIIYSLIKENNQDSSLVISNDIYAYQIPALVQRAYLLRTSIKGKSLLTYNNVVYGQFKNVTQFTLSPKLIPVLMALNKCDALGLKLILPYKTAINNIKLLVDKGIICNGYNPPNAIIEDKLKILGLTGRWCLSDLTTQAFKYMTSPAILDETWKVKKACDLNELASILDNRFNNDPENILNYIFLLE
jgi:hypothetical protein